MVQRQGMSFSHGTAHACWQQQTPPATMQKVQPVHVQSVLCSEKMQPSEASRQHPSKHRQQQHVVLHIVAMLGVSAQ